MIVVSIMNYKGGVGKTTITANLAAEIAWRNHRVLLLDIDSQASLTFSFISPDEWENNYANSKTIKQWFDSILDDDLLLSLNDFIFEPSRVNSCLRHRQGKLSLVASHLGLIDVDSNIDSKTGGGVSFDKMAKSFLKRHQWLSQGIQELILDDKYDIILIDCPPNFNTVTKNAIVASDYILVPAKADYLSTLGINYLQNNVDKLIENFNKLTQFGDSIGNEISPEIVGVVFNMIQIYGGSPISTARPYMRQVKQLDIPVFESYIRENKSIFANAPEFGIPMVLNGTGDSKFQEIRTEVENFVGEFITRIGL